MNKWDKRFSKIAKEVSTWSKDPSTQVGVVAVRERRILSTGYNGFPVSIEDTPYRLDNKEIKYQYVIHGEANCIYNAAENGIPLRGSTIYVYGLPVCSECAKAIIQSGVSRVVMVLSKKTPEKWGTSFKKTEEMFRECGIKFEINALLSDENKV